MPWWQIAALTVGALAGAIAALAAGLWWWMIRMPGRSFRGVPGEPDDALRALADELRRDVEAIAGEIGERNLTVNPAGLERTAAYLEAQLRAAGLAPRRETFVVDGVPVHNVYAEVAGQTDEVLVLCAHYDTVPGSPGANDNTSAIAGVLALARRVAGAPGRPRMRFLFPVNEERPYFMTPDMGALRHADGCAERGERLVGVVNLETVGYYTDEPGSQKYPPPLSWVYPSTGHFVAFVANARSRRFVHRLVRAFRETAEVPSEGAAVTERFRDIGRSDHAAFWAHGWPGVMVTDTADFRYAPYHTPDDTPDRLDYVTLARVVRALLPAIRAL